MVAERRVTGSREGVGRRRKGKGEGERIYWRMPYWREEGGIESDTIDGIDRIDKRAKRHEDVSAAGAGGTYCTLYLVPNMPG